jgi:hypothetical protein
VALSAAFGAVVNGVGVSDPNGGGSGAAAALIDTGAQQSCIAAALVRQLGLSPVGLQPIISATGFQNCNTHIVDIDVRFTVGVSTISGLLVIELQIAASHPQLIFGRDVLTRAGSSFSLANNQFTFCL